MSWKGPRTVGRSVGWVGRRRVGAFSSLFAVRAVFLHLDVEGVGL